MSSTPIICFCSMMAARLCEDERGGARLFQGARCGAKPGISQIGTEKKHKASVKVRMLFVVKSNDEDPRFRLR